MMAATPILGRNVRDIALSKASNADNGLAPEFAENLSRGKGFLIEDPFFLIAYDG